MSKTKIEWTDETWNPVTGCTKVSQGCKHCYAERFAKRIGYDFSQVELHPERLEIPLHWKKPRRIFVNSMSDLFHEKVPDYFIQRVFSTMNQARQHVYQILTKRPQRMYAFCKDQESFGMTPLQNVWLGVSAEDQKAADERIPILLETPAAVRFVSCEPLLGPLDLNNVRRDDRGYKVDALRGIHWLPGWKDFQFGCGKLDWVIVGGESGPGARPMHPAWARSIRDQCREANVLFFFKQWGEWTARFPQGLNLANREMTYEYGTGFYRVGRKAAGRTLDGREWNEYPPILWPKGKGIDGGER